MERALGSTHEVSLRMLLLLEMLDGKKVTVDMLAAIDFITVYGHDFEITEDNLHGNGTYRFGEFALRRDLVKDALRLLVVEGIVSVTPQKRGFLYQLTFAGIDFSSGFECDYSDDYRFASETVIRRLNGKSEHEITRMINQRVLLSLQRS